MTKTSRPTYYGLSRYAAFTLLSIACFATAPRALADDLTPEQQKALATVQANLPQVETNLKLAQDAAGPGDAKPTGSKAKLAMMRLQTAKGPIPQLQELMATLPAEHADVKATQKRLDDIKVAADVLETRITGEAPMPAGGDEQGVKLDYRQEEQLKNARFALRDLKGRAAALAELVTELKGIENQQSIDHRRVQVGINTIEVADRRAKETQDALAPLPADGRGVKSAQEELKQAVANVESSRQFLVPLHAKLSQLIDPASYPTLTADLDRLRELGVMFADPTIFNLDRVRAADLVRVAPAARAERDDLVKRYATLVQQQTPEGKRIEGISNHFTQTYLEFAAAAQQQIATLPGEINGHLNEARQWAAEAVSEQKPLFFTGGIPQTLGFAEEKIALLDTLDAAKAKEMRTRLDQTRTELKKAEDSLRESIIAANELPSNNYTHDDRAALEKLATDAWKKLQPDAEVLTIRIPSDEWKRSTMWRYSNDTWYKVDHSKLQVRLIVRHDDKLAAIRAIDLWKDHLSNDKLEAAPLDTPDAELQPQELLSLDKVK